MSKIPGKIKMFYQDVWLNCNLQDEKRIRRNRALFFSKAKLATWIVICQVPPHILWTKILQDANWKTP